MVGEGVVVPLPGEDFVLNLERSCDLYSFIPLGLGLRLGLRGAPRCTYVIGSKTSSVELRRVLRAHYECVA
jgi:hypothetical protein